MEMHIIKRRGYTEQFDERKIYASCYASCLNVPIERHEAEKIAEKATSEIKKWIKNKQKITSNELFKEVVKELYKLNKEAAFMYESHRDVS